MNLTQDFFRSLRLVIVLWVLTAIVYPVVILVIGQVAFPYQANGSVINNTQGEPIGSALIGQPFKGDRYFWSRPSAIDYATQPAIVQTGTSGASNLAPSNPALLDRIKPEAQRLQNAQTKPVADLLYSSGSGLDPHISLEAAQAQIQRVAQMRKLSEIEVQTLISKAVEGRFIGLFGEPGVNVLKLNLSLDQP
jgi:potassium-transporting ATPase KdpC subunit